VDKNLSPNYEVHCVCGGFGFPHGTASTNRILLIGRALLSAEVPFYVWHIGPSAVGTNSGMGGIHQGVRWEFLSPSVRRPASRWLRMVYFFYGCVLLPVRLVSKRRRICVYCYYQGDALNLWILVVCRLLGIPVAQECCEWWPGTADETFINGLLYSKVMFRWSSGALPISTLIEKRIRQIVGPSYPLARVPVLVDSEEVQREKDTPPSSVVAGQSYLFWCGMVDGYLRDPLFLIEVLGVLAREHSLKPALVLSGPCSQGARDELHRAVEAVGVESNQLIITGFLSEVELFRLATHASVALMPLWDDDRSKTRFPTKLGLYVAAGCPVVTCAVGEVAHYLHDNQTALFANNGDKVDWAKSICKLLISNNLSDEISFNIKSKLFPIFDYKYVSKKIKNLFDEIYIKK
jgi:glycosyltransferase involved in cell wall biosynthesis